MRTTAAYGWDTSVVRVKHASGCAERQFVLHRRVDVYCNSLYKGHIWTIEARV